MQFTGEIRAIFIKYQRLIGNCFVDSRVAGGERFQYDPEIGEITEKEVIVINDSQPEQNTDTQPLNLGHKIPTSKFSNSLLPQPSQEEVGTAREPRPIQDPDRQTSPGSNLPSKKKIKKKRTENWVVQSEGTLLSISKRTSDPNDLDRLLAIFYAKCLGST